MSLRVAKRRSNLVLVTAKKIILNLFSVLLVLAIFYFLGREFVRDFEHIRNYTFNFNIPLLLTASAFYAIGFFLLTLGWRLFLSYIHYPIPLLNALVYFCVTQPSKYIPGKVWLAISRMKFCKKHAIPHSITLLSTGAEGVFEIFAGAYISLIAILQTDILGKFTLPATALVSAAGLLLLIPRVFYFFINIYLKIAKQTQLPKDHRVSFSKLLLLQITYGISVFLLSAAQVFFLQSFAPVSLEHFPFLISIGAFSYVASIVAFFAPSGLGVREGIWFLALKTLVAPSVALIYSFASRLWMIIVEVILMIVALPFLRKLRGPSLATTASEHGKSKSI